MRTKVIRDGLVGDLKPGSILDRGFLQKKLRDTFIKAFPQDLLDQPHYLGETGGHQFVCVVGKRRGFLHNAFVGFRRDHPEFRIFFRLYGHLELHGMYHAGCGKQTHISVKKTVKSDFPPLVRKNIRPELS